jgi:hypothetical protein
MIRSIKQLKNLNHGIKYLLLKKKMQGPYRNRDSPLEKGR